MTTFERELAIVNEDITQFTKNKETLLYYSTTNTNPNLNPDPNPNPNKIHDNIIF